MEEGKQELEQGKPLDKLKDLVLLYAQEQTGKLTADKFSYITSFSDDYDIVNDNTRIRLSITQCEKNENGLIPVRRDNIDTILYFEELNDKDTFDEYVNFFNDYTDKVLARIISRENLTHGS